MTREAFESLLLRYPAWRDGLQRAREAFRESVCRELERTPDNFEPLRLSEIARRALAARMT